MAFLPDREVNRLLRKSPLTPPPTKKSITDEKEFKEKLRKVPEQGFVVDEGEAIDGVTGVAAPIRDFTHKVVAAVGIGFISSSEDSKELKRIIRDTVRTAQIISQELGYFSRRPVLSPVVSD